MISRWNGEGTGSLSESVSALLCRLFSVCIFKKNLLVSVNMTVRGDLVGLKYNQCGEKYLSFANRLNSLKVDVASVEGFGDT